MHCSPPPPMGLPFSLSLYVRSNWSLSRPREFIDFAICAAISSFLRTHTEWGGLTSLSVYFMMGDSTVMSRSIRPFLPDAQFQGFVSSQHFQSSKLWIDESINEWIDRTWWALRDHSNSSMFHEEVKSFDLFNFSRKR